MNNRNSDFAFRIGVYPNLTADNAVQFREQACAALEGQTSVDLDLSQTTAMDCAGVGALNAVRNLTPARRGVVRLLHPTPAVQRLLNILQATERFDIVDAPPPALPQFTGVGAPALDTPSIACR